MQEYLTKHNLKTKEQIAQHIVELKRNTIPDLGLISSLCSYLFSGEKTDNLVSIPIDATNIEVFHLDTKDNGDRTAFIGFKISNGNFSFVEVPFTSQKLAEKETKTVTMPFGREFLTVVVEKENHNKQRELNEHIREILKDAGTKDHGEVKPNSTRHKPPVHCGGYGKIKFSNKDNGLLSKKPFYNFLDGEIRKYNFPKEELIFKDNPYLGEKYPEILGAQMKRGNIIDYSVGKKETEGKVNYEELDFDYIDSMALRMSKNLEKYPPKNWQRKMEIKELAKSAMRHARKILQEIDGDDETLEDHAIALGCNGMMINYQLKLNKP